MPVPYSYTCICCVLRVLTGAHACARLRTLSVVRLEVSGYAQQTRPQVVCMLPTTYVAWRGQGEDANPLQKRLAGVVENYQVIGGDLGPGRLQNVVNLLPGVTVREAIGSQENIPAWCCADAFNAHTSRLQVR